MAGPDPAICPRIALPTRSVLTTGSSARWQALHGIDAAILALVAFVAARARAGHSCGTVPADQPGLRRACPVLTLHGIGVVILALVAFVPAGARVGHPSRRSAGRP